MADVSLEQVDKIYPNGVRAVNGVSLSVRDGERLVLVGPSGCGKTSILRLIAGLERATSGSIHIGGRAVDDLPPRAREVGLVAQRPGLYPHLRVRDNLAFGLRLRSGSTWLTRWLRKNSTKNLEAEVSQRVAEAAKLLDLEAVLERWPRQLSGGQQQRVALGRALVCRPAVLLLDEPLASLDPPLRADLRRQLHLLQQRFLATMIYVTHDQLEAMTLGERVVVLDRGIVQQVDRPEVVYRRPANRFVAGFVGWPSMSFLAGRLVWNESGRFQTAEEALPVPASLERWRALGNLAVELGIRPEDVHLRPTAAASTGLTLEVGLIEPLGSEALVTCRRADRQLTLKTAWPARLAVGQTVEVFLDLTQAHLFDVASGQVLGAPAE